METTTAIISAVGLIVGYAIKSVIDYVNTKNEIESSDQNQFYDNILERMEKLEADQKELKAKLNLWIERYWALYFYLMHFCLANGIEKVPPQFHEMDISELKEKKFRERVQHEEV